MYPGVCGRYMEVGQLDSAVLLLESALVRHQMELGTSRNRTVVSNSKLFDEWIMQVPEDRRPTVTFLSMTFARVACEAVTCLLPV